MIRLVALLRGINVGGNNKLAMSELRATIESLGFSNVVTHIQSGNVVFDGGADPAIDAAVQAAGISDRIAGAIAARHGLVVSVVVRTGEQIRRIAGAHPEAESGIDPKMLHVMFLDTAPGHAAAEAIDPQRYLPDSWTIDGTEIYLSYPTGSGRSKLTIQVFERALAVTATARNLNTVRAVAELAGTPEF